MPSSGSSPENQPTQVQLAPYASAAAARLEALWLERNKLTRECARVGSTPEAAPTARRHALIETADLHTKFALLSR